MPINIDKKYVLILIFYLSFISLLICVLLDGLLNYIEINKSLYFILFGFVSFFSTFLDEKKGYVIGEFKWISKMDNEKSFKFSIVLRRILGIFLIILGIFYFFKY